MKLAPALSASLSILAPLAGCQVDRTLPPEAPAVVQSAQYNQIQGVFARPAPALAIERNLRVAIPRSAEVAAQNGAYFQIHNSCAQPNLVADAPLLHILAACIERRGVAEVDCQANNCDANGNCDQLNPDENRCCNIAALMGIPDQRADEDQLRADAATVCMTGIDPRHDHSFLHELCVTLSSTQCDTHSWLTEMDSLRNLGLNLPQNMNNCADSFYPPRDLVMEACNFCGVQYQIGNNGRIIFFN